MSDEIKVFVTDQAMILGKDILGRLAQFGYDHFIKSNGQCSLHEYVCFQGISFDEPIYVNSFPSPVNGKCVVAIISRPDLPTLGLEAQQYIESWLNEPKTTERVVNLTDGPKVELKETERVHEQHLPLEDEDKEAEEGKQ